MTQRGEKERERERERESERERERKRERDRQIDRERKRERGEREIMEQRGVLKMRYDSLHNYVSNTKTLLLSL